MSDVKSEKAVKAFAAAHGLEFHKRNPPQLPFASLTHPLQSGRRELVVQGMWREHFIQRFIADGYAVELLVLPFALPTLQLVPTLASYDREPAVGPLVPMTDAHFGEHWRLSSENASFAYDFVTPPVREALAHEAAYGKAVGLEGRMLFLFSPLAPVTADELRVRFEFLAVLASRIDIGVWQRWARGGLPTGGVPMAPPAPSATAMSMVPIVPPTTPGTPPLAPPVPDAVFVPDPAISLTGEIGPRPVVPAMVNGIPNLPPPVAPAGGWGNTTELDVAMLNSQLNGAFVPSGAAPPEDQGWIGGDEVDQSRIYFTGPRLKGQARPRV